MPGSSSSPIPTASQALDAAETTAPLLASHLLAVAIGGAAGAVLRYLVSVVGTRMMPEHPERATVVINAFGSLLLGAVLAWTLARPDHLHPALHTGLAVGLLGAFTTYSTFSVEALKLMQNGRLAEATLYVVVTTVLCIALAAAGYGAITAMLGKPTP
ncbi:MAG: fluoride efflux transporter CrcB [Phycisphaerales bacterium JB065]